MTTFADYLKNVQLVKSRIPTETGRIIMEKKQEILDLNREDQLFEMGVDSDGRKLGLYKPSTLRRKQADPLVTRYTRYISLFNHGDFYRGWDLKYENGKVTLFSRDEKSSMLQEDYPYIFGLIVNNARRMNYSIILPDLQAFSKKYL